MLLFLAVLPGWLFVASQQTASQQMVVRLPVFAGTAQDRSGEAQAELAAATAQAAREVAAAQRAAGRAKAAAAELAEDMEAARDEAESATAERQARRTGSWSVGVCLPGSKCHDVRMIRGGAASHR